METLKETYDRLKHAEKLFSIECQNESFGQFALRHLWLAVRNEVERQEKLDLKLAMDFLCKNLKEDLDYRRAWKDNISIQFQDSYNQKIDKTYFPNYDIKKIADEAAEEFLRLLCIEEK